MASVLYSRDCCPALTGCRALDRDVDVRANGTTGFGYAVNVQPNPASRGWSIQNVDAAAASVWI
jgi:hypothetical protein